MKYLLLLFICGCSTTELVTPTGARYVSKRPPFAKLEVKSVSIEKKYDGYKFTLEGMNHDATSGYVEVSKFAIQQAITSGP